MKRFLVEPMLVSQVAGERVAKWGEDALTKPITLRWVLAIFLLAILVFFFLPTITH